jgi:B12-binding domain/radical SAM domain protein
MTAAMMGRTVLLLLDAKQNRHSLNALLGALETDRKLDDLEIRLPANEAQLGQNIGDALSAGRRPIVGLSFATPQFWQITELMCRLKKPFHDGLPALWVAGGPHPTADPEGTLRLGFDIVVLGEGEATLLDLLETVTADGGLAEVPGLAFRGPSGETIFTRHRTSIDLDQYPPFPLRRSRRVGPIEITRGCPFACGYCQTSQLFGTQPRHRSVETIAHYANVIRQKNPCDVRLITPNAFSYGSADGKRLNFPVLESLLATLRQTLGVAGRLFFGTFPSEVRPEHVNGATLELVKRYANNDCLVIGAQSGSEKVLARCGRGHGVAEIMTAVSQTIAAGLRPHVDFIFGLPDETPEDVKSTVEVIRELAAMGALIHAHTFMPLPQTRFARECPGVISSRLRPVIKELIRGGVLSGVWHKQEREAKHMAQYIRDGRM